MPQNATSVIGNTIAGTTTQAQGVVTPNVKETTITADYNLQSTGATSTAQCLKVGTGTVKVLESLNPQYLAPSAAFTTSTINALTTSYVTALYDTSSFAVGSLTTSQVSTLTTSTLIGLFSPTVAVQAFNVPYKYGLVVVPGGPNFTPTILVNVVYK